MQFIEQPCVCDRWIVLVDPDVWVHQDDMTQCRPARPVDAVYLDEAV